MDAHNGPAWFLALEFGGGRRTTEPEEKSKQQAAVLQVAESTSRSFYEPHHSLGLFLKFKAT